MRAPALVGALLSVSSALQAPQLHAKRAAPLQSTLDRAANREQTDAVGRYCADDKQPQRRATSTVKVGQVRIGSSDPIVLQTMGTTDTNDVQASVEQILRCKEAGADMVRLTVQGIGEAKNSLKIREQLDAQGVHIPLVADMHFNRKAAMIACEAYDKIRVNPGNFADGRKTFEEIDYDVTGGVLGTRRRRVWFDAIDAFPSRGGRRRSESRASHGRYQHRTRSSSKMNEPTSRRRSRPWSNGARNWEEPSASARTTGPSQHVLCPFMATARRAWSKVRWSSRTSAAN